jgi:hypothetical protein
VKSRSKDLDLFISSVGQRVRARERDAGTALITQPNPTRENKM